MKTSSRALTTAKAKAAGKVTSTKRKATSAIARKRTTKSATNVAIATELAPAVAIALLEKSDQAPGAPPPALDCLAAGVSASEDKGKVRVQLLFDSGAVLPVEMSVAAGAALSDSLAKELPATK